MSVPESGIDIRGAVDLSALATPPAARQDAEGDFVVEATAATFTAVVEQSQTVPVIVELYSGRSQASVKLTDTLLTIVKEYNGAFLLARVNADAEPDIAAAFGVQAIPTVVALVGTRPIPLFQGVHESAQITQVLDEVLRVAQENGVTGTLEASEQETAEEVEEPLPPNIQAAYDAIEAQDYQGAISAFEAELAIHPADAEAKAGLVQARLLARLGEDDPADLISRADEQPFTALEPHLRAADAELGGGDLRAAFDRLLGVIAATTGEEREQARQRLVELFGLAPEGSPEVARARQRLAAALF